MKRLLLILMFMMTITAFISSKTLKPPTEFKSIVLCEAIDSVRQMPTAITTEDGVIFKRLLVRHFEDRTPENSNRDWIEEFYFPGNVIKPLFFSYGDYILFGMNDNRYLILESNSTYYHNIGSLDAESLLERSERKGLAVKALLSNDSSYTDGIFDYMSTVMNMGENESTLSIEIPIAHSNDKITMVNIPRREIADYLDSLGSIKYRIYCNVDGVPQNIPPLEPLLEVNDTIMAMFDVYNKNMSRLIECAGNEYFVGLQDVVRVSQEGYMLVYDTPHAPDNLDMIFPKHINDNPRLDKLFDMPDNYASCRKNYLDIKHIIDYIEKNSEKNKIEQLSFVLTLYSKTFVFFNVDIDDVYSCMLLAKKIAFSNSVSKPQYYTFNINKAQNNGTSSGLFVDFQFPFNNISPLTEGYVKFSDEKEYSDTNNDILFELPDNVYLQLEVNKPVYRLIDSSDRGYLSASNIDRYLNKAIKDHDRDLISKVRRFHTSRINADSSHVNILISQKRNNITLLFLNINRNKLPEYIDSIGFIKYRQYPDKNAGVPKKNDLVPLFYTNDDIVGLSHKYKANMKKLRKCANTSSVTGLEDMIQIPGQGYMLVYNTPNSKNCIDNLNVTYSSIGTETKELISLSDNYAECRNFVIDVEKIITSINKKYKQGKDSNLSNVSFFITLNNKTFLFLDINPEDLYSCMLLAKKIAAI